MEILVYAFLNVKPFSFKLDINSIKKNHQKRESTEIGKVTNNYTSCYSISLSLCGFCIGSRFKSAGFYPSSGAVRFVHCNEKTAAVSSPNYIINLDTCCDDRTLLVSVIGHDIWFF